MMMVNKGAATNEVSIILSRLSILFMMHSIFFMIANWKLLSESASTEYHALVSIVAGASMISL